MPTETNEKLRTAVERLYAVFESYPLARSIKVYCDCCDYSEDEAKLRAKPLRLLDREELDAMIWHGGNNWGEPDDFKHFLPRIFEILSILDAPSPPTNRVAGFFAHHLPLFFVQGEWEVILEQLVTCDWKPDELDALRAYLTIVRPKLSTKVADKVRAWLGEGTCVPV